ncbi:hypothetical protein HII12_000137 [Brettanomyces bruxellensis]|uniref:Uncharacterized protein n=1 Tax=Dekkera bruxellensis TaxID=5007 RepID=A0A8H6EZP7_DEKBR|nr:hypothetical protein HII12_000137 [Brettanomyces bruxellensis]
MYSYSQSSRCLGLLVRKVIAPRKLIIKRLIVTNNNTDEGSLSANGKLEKSNQEKLLDDSRTYFKDQRRLENLACSISQEQKVNNLNSADIDPKSEKSIVSVFYNLVDFKSFNSVPESDYDTTALIRKKRTGKKLPRPPDGLSPVKLDQYIKLVNEMNFNANRKLSRAISNIYREIIDSQTLLNIKSFNIIVRFFSVEYNFAMVRTILFEMVGKHIKPDVNTFNCILSVIKSMKSPYKNDLFKTYLNQMKIFDVIPDSTTWYIMFEFLEKEKLPFYNKMKELEISMKPIFVEYLRFLHKYKGNSVEELLTLLEKEKIHLDKHLLTTFVQIELEDDNAQKAFELLDSFAGPGGRIKRVDFNSLITMVKYFAADRMQPYFAIATINYFRSHYGLSLKIYRCYVELAKGMLKCPYFKNWSILTRIYYKESMMGVGQSLINKKDIHALNERAKSFEIEDFDISKLKNDEYAEAIFNFHLLQWVDTPILKLEENEPQFIEAANYMIPHKGSRLNTNETTL